MTPKALRELVATMRDLGVTECGDVKLGPAPLPARTPLTSDEQVAADKAKREATEERQRDIMFAASHVKPVLRSVK